MTTLAYPSYSTNSSYYGPDSSRMSSTSYLNIDSQSIVKLEPMDQDYEAACRIPNSSSYMNEFSSCLMNSKSSKSAFQLFSESSASLMSWTNKHPENWSDSEILDWVYFVADTHRFDGSKLRGEAYQTLSGTKLCQMSKDEFEQLDPNFGSKMHDLFKTLIGSASYTAPNNPESFNYESVCDFPSLRNQSDPSYINNYPQAESKADLLDFSVLIGGHLYDIDVESKLNLLPEDKLDFDSCYPTPETAQSEKIDQGYVSGGSEGDHDWTLSNPNIYDWSSTDDDTSMTCMPMIPYNKLYSSTTKRRVQAGGSISSEEGDELPYGMKTARPKAKTGGSKGNHLWEFVRDLLKDSSVNPSLLKWEDKATGVFRFVNSEAIAQLWGKKKNNRQMTYEKLSRAMRFCRTSGYFESIPKNGRFPKKLCFKFGPKAHGWQD